MRSGHSSAGTRKTTPYINHNSKKYISRSAIGQTKRGNVAKQKDAAHIGSFGLFNAIHTHLPGRPLSLENQNKVKRTLNADKNLRVKSRHGNRVLDERRDARIANAFVNKRAIEGGTTIKRAVDSFQQIEKTAMVPSVARAMGNMKVVLKDGTKTTVRDVTSTRNK